MTDEYDNKNYDPREYNASQILGTGPSQIMGTGYSQILGTGPSQIMGTGYSQIMADTQTSNTHSAKTIHSGNASLNGHGSRHGSSNNSGKKWWWPFGSTASNNTDQDDARSEKQTPHSTTAEQQDWAPSYRNIGVGFSGETRIMTPQGWSRIDSLKENDIISVWDESAKKLTARRIIQVISFTPAAMWNFDAIGHNRPINAIKRQSFLTKTGWLKLDELDDTSRVLTIGEKNGWRKISQITETMKSDLAFSLVMAGQSNFIAEGYVVKSVRPKNDTQQNNEDTIHL